MNARRVASVDRILFVSHYYPPETNAPATRVSELAREWTAAGRHVEILTGMPNHPTGIIPSEYRGAWYRRETHDTVTVHRGRVYAAANKGHARRILNYLSFMVSAIITGVFKTGRTDCVVATSPQLFCAAAGWVLSVVKRAPFVFEVRDVWPAEIVAVGAITNRFIIRALELLEEFLYRRASRIVAVANGTIEILTARGIPEDKILLIPNGVDTRSFEPGARTNWVREQHGLNGETVVSYIGTIGMAHRLEVMLDAASLLKDNPNFRFLIVGDGAERDRLESETERRGLRNVIWEDSQPRNRIAAYYQASDMCVVHLRKVDLFTKNIPSKMYEIMSCGRPMLLGTEGESRRLGLRSGSAEAFIPEDPQDLARAIMALSVRPERQARMGAAGRAFAVSRYDRRFLAREYLDVLDGLVAETHRHTEIVARVLARERAA